MKDILIITVADEQVIEILTAFIHGEVSLEELTTWAVLMIDAKERDHLLTYSQAVQELLLTIEMTEEHDPFTHGQARDAIANIQRQSR